MASSCSTVHSALHMPDRPLYRLVQPWGGDPGREATLVSEHATVGDAFAELDGLTAQMARTGAPHNVVELRVVDADGRVIPRPMVS